MILTVQDFWQWSDYIKPIALVDPTDEELPSNTECQSSGYGMSQHINGNPGIGSIQGDFQPIIGLSLRPFKLKFHGETFTQ